MKSEGRSQQPGVSRRNSEAGNRQSEVGGRKPDIRNHKGTASPVHHFCSGSWFLAPVCFLLASAFWLPAPAFAGTHVTATYDLGANPKVMATVGGTAEYGLVFVQRNKAVTYNGVQYGMQVEDGYLDAGGNLNDGAGNLWLALIPNSAASPSDSYYVVTVNIQGKVHSEIWVVPDTASIAASLLRQAQPPSPVPPALYYQTVEQAGAALPRRLRLNFLGAGVSCADNAGQLSTDCTFAAASGGSAHNLLSVTHSDTAPAAVQRGAIVSGQGAAPVWTLLALGAAGHYLESNGTDLVYSFGAASGTGACATHNFATALNADAAPNCSQPAFTDLAGSAARSQLPTATVFTDQANTWTAGAQDFGGAASLKVPVAAGAAPSASGTVAYDSTSNTFKGGVNLAAKTFASTDSNLTGTAANVSGIVAAANGGTGAANAATAGRYLRADGTNFVASAVAAGGAGACSNQFVRATNDNLAPTCATVGAGDVAIASPSGAQLSGVSSANLATANKTLEKSVVIFSPAATDSNMVQLYFGQAVTLVRIACSTDAGSVGINFDTRTEAAPNTAGTNVLGSNLSCTTLAGTTTAFSSSAVSADAPLNLQVASVSGSPNAVRIHVKATIN